MQRRERIPPDGVLEAAAPRVARAPRGAGSRFGRRGPPQAAISHPPLEPHCTRPSVGT